MVYQFFSVLTSCGGFVCCFVMLIVFSFLWESNEYQFFKFSIMQSFAFCWTPQSFPSIGPTFILKILEFLFCISSVNMNPIPCKIQCKTGAFLLLLQVQDELLQGITLVKYLGFRSSPYSGPSLICFGLFVKITHPNPQGLYLVSTCLNSHSIN